MENRKSTSELNVMERLNAPTPKFFKKLRTAGLVLAAVGGVLVTTPIALPAMLVAMGGYLIVAGSVATAISQVTVEEPEINKKKDSVNGSADSSSR